jgi:hypothetical protein
MDGSCGMDGDCMGEHGRRANWGQTITPETLHVSVGYISRAWAARASKHASGRPSKLDMFWLVVGFKVLVSRLMYHDTQFSTGGNKC